MLSLAANPLPFKAPEAHERPPFSDVTRGLADIDGSGPEQLSSAVLRADLKWFAMQQDVQGQRALSTARVSTSPSAIHA
jgi:hypothetical protein